MDPENQRSDYVAWVVTAVLLVLILGVASLVGFDVFHAL